MPTFSVDGQEIEFAEGRSILEALDDAGVLMQGVDVPHYCWHPKLPVDGSCRLCQVEVEGMPKLQIACNTPVQDGMVVHTSSPEVKKAVETLFKVAVDDVNTLIVRGRMRRMGPSRAKTKNWKKAIVTLKDGESIDFFEGA